MRDIYLYKRNAQGKPIKWELHESGKALIMSSGVVGAMYHTCVIDPKRVTKNEFDARVAEKRKAGYKTVEELRDNAPTRDELIKESNLINYLNAYLPKYNILGDGLTSPMLAKIVEDNKPFQKNRYLGQWKINGLRCIIKCVHNNNDIFKYYRFRYFSRTGTEWTNMSWFDDILVQSVNDGLRQAMLDEDVALDGEFYLPGYTVNDIDSFIKNDTLPQHYQLQYWCYDLAWQDVCYQARKYQRDKGLKNADIKFEIDKSGHLNNKKQFVNLPDIEVSNIIEARDYRDSFIDKGFEGLIIRDMDAQYQFGKRNMSMMKYKKILDGKFKIVDIVAEGVRKDLPKFVLCNDINDELFECTINLPQANQREIYATRNNFIGMYAFVEYRERSGVKQVPFHAKIIRII